jgi:hypothetical protein
MILRQNYYVLISIQFKVLFNPIDGLKTHLTKPSSEATINSSDIVYNSPINEKLKGFGRQLLIDSNYFTDTNHYEAVSPSNSIQLSGRYSSEKTHVVDPDLQSYMFWTPI